MLSSYLPDLQQKLIDISAGQLEGERLVKLVVRERVENSTEEVAS